MALQASLHARIAVLASGGGSNLQAILDYLATLGAQRAGDVVLVASDRAESPALNRARNAGIEAQALKRNVSGEALLEELSEKFVTHVVLAGYLRLVPAEVARAYRGRMVNVHPALLPSFGGRGMFGERVHAAVIGAGVGISGATVHFVDEVYDRGAIIAQWPVPVSPNDTPATLGARVLAVEHLLYPRVIQALCSRRIQLADDGRVVGVPVPESAAAFTMGDYVGLRHALDRWLGG